MFLKDVLFGNEHSIDKNAYTFNTIFGVLNALQSVVMLAIITRICGLALSGVFVIAWTVSNILLNVGKFGMRSYQATDIGYKFSFNQYLYSRVVTTVVMLLVSLFYSCLMFFLKQYDIEKAVIVVLLTSLKCVDSIEDIYLGEYQRRGRMDVASKIGVIRLFLTIASYAILILLTKELIISTLITSILSCLIVVVFIALTFGDITELNTKDAFIVDRTADRTIVDLIRSCVGIFLSMFLYTFCINVPKFAIDLSLSSADQSLFGFISMPVFCVSLLSQFIFAPKLKFLADIISDKSTKSIKKTFGIQMLFILFFTVLAIIVAMTFGAPVISWIYGTNVVFLKKELTILMVGSGFMAFSYYVTNLLVIIRRQSLILVSYIIAAVTVILMCTISVSKYGIMGASISFTVGMVVLAICMLLIMYRCRFEIFGNRESRDV